MNGGAAALPEDGTARPQPVLTLPVPKRTKAEKPGRCGDRLLEKYFHFLPVWLSGLSEQSHTQQKTPICGLAHLPISYFSFVKNDQTPQTTRHLTRKRFSFFCVWRTHQNCMTLYDHCINLKTQPKTVTASVFASCGPLTHLFFFTVSIVSTVWVKVQTPKQMFVDSHI